MKNKLLILIVGIPGSGKTTFANLLSCKMAGIPSINTDIIKAAYASSNPDIMKKTSHTAWQLLGECTNKNIVSGNNILSREIFKISCEIVGRLFETYNTVIIEGLGIDLESVPNLEVDTVIFYLTNKDKHLGYKDKLRYRVNKTNNWAKHKEILQIIDEDIFRKTNTLKNAFTIEITDGYDLDKIVEVIELCRKP